MPYLVADPQPEVDVDFYEVELDGVTVRSDPEREDGMVRLHHDLTGISVGEHKVRVRAVNRWATSDYTPFLEFTSGAPPDVTGLTIESSYMSFHMPG
jgi:hypothetical protein